ncbi:eukaryotic aspartyl protease [Botrytis cinerea]
MKIRFHNGLLFALIVVLKVTASPLNGVPEDQLKSDRVVPSPLVIPASQYFDGDDGEWSSLALRVGSPAQDVRVLVSTNSPQTLVVLPLGCTSAAISPVPSGCANARGGLFNNSLSNTWEDIGLFEINENGVGFQADLGYSQSADFGLDSIGLGYVSGTNGPTLDNQTIGAIATASPFYTGVFGLGTQPVNFTTVGNYSSESYFSSLWSQSLIPSLAWSYTAGAKYRLKAGQYAQLIFGGYDTSRFLANSASFTLSSDINRDIVVAIQAITYSGTTQASLLETPTYAFIESTDPNFWLPEAVCQKFENAFGLSLDDSTGLYLINSTQYSLLISTNPQVTFSLANSLSGGDIASIVLPFNAFALSASYPFVPNDTYYFPLRKSANDSQNTLGRAFLQEAYLTVDYERGNFTVSQCTFVDGATAEISTIISPTLADNSSSVSSNADSTDPTKHLSIGIICGIAVALVAVLIVGALGGFYLFRRRNRHISTAEIALRGINGTFPKDGSRMTPSPNPSSIPPMNPSPDPLSNQMYMQEVKPIAEAPGHETRELVELQSPDLNNQSNFIHFTNKPTEIFTKTSEDPYEDYTTAARRIESQRKFATSSEMDAGSTIYELPGSNPLVEMDDERSRHTLSPRLAPSPKSAQFYQGQTLLSQHSSYQNLSPAMSEQSPSPRVSSTQGRISPFEVLTNKTSTHIYQSLVAQNPSRQQISNRPSIATTH